MSNIDWAILLGTLLFIVAYGVFKTRGQKNIEGYLRGNSQSRWWAIGLSIMATQASAITFLSTPGLGYEDGMGFVQFYFGLPIALIVISVFFIPLYYRLKVFTAYEFLEQRFDVKTRFLAAGLFLISRGLAAGITIYAPAIVLSAIIGWNLETTILFIGTLVIIYTVSGGTKAVSQTHKLQMAVMMGGMVVALIMIFYYLSDTLSPGEAIAVAGKLGRMEIIDLNFDPTSKYNIWSGLIGGSFLALSYFGTDQSQVQRYISGKSLGEIRLGLMFNALLKVPMQLLILFIGVMTFVFFQIHKPPVFFNEVAVNKVIESDNRVMFEDLDDKHTKLFEEKKAGIGKMLTAIRAEDEQALQQASVEVNSMLEKNKEIRSSVKGLISATDEDEETKDDDYVFISFIIGFMPVGLIGLLLAVMFSAAMSSTAAELNALASTSTIDFYKRVFKKEASEKHYLNSSKMLTFGWGILAILFAMAASLFDNLVEAVNILGSLFYGTILGIFLVAFFFKYIKGQAVFIAAIISELAIIALYVLNTKGVIEIAYLWYNLIGPALVIVLATIFQLASRKT